MYFTKQEIETFVIKFEKELLASKKIDFTFDKKWSSNFAINNKKGNAGIYAIFDKTKLVYVGETANLKERMKEVKRTYNHSFRRKLGRKLNPELIKNPKGSFSDKIENELDQYFLDNISFSFKELNFGRLEVESYLIHRNHNKGLLNSLGKRNRI